MFPNEPAETPMDLRFWLFGTHVRVQPMFWLLSAVLGWGLVAGGGRTGLFYLGIWVVCVFVSVLLHEFGHVFMGRLFGSHGHIVLTSFGGLAIGSNALERGWQRFLVSFAGPLIQFALLGVTVLAMFILLPKVPKSWQEMAEVTFVSLIYINLVWPIINLLPIWPLDGGQMAREVFAAVAPRNGTTITLVVSACTAGLMAFCCVFPEVVAVYIPVLQNMGRQIFMAFFFGMLGVQSLMALPAATPTRRIHHENDDEFPWER